MEMIDKVALMLIRARKVLFVRSKGKDEFFTLGGKRDPGESDEQTIVREVFEEIGARVIPGSLAHFETVNDFVHNKPHVPLKLSCYLGDIQGEPAPSSEIEELAWLGSDGDLTHKLTKTGTAVLKLLAERGLID